MKTKCRTPTIMGQCSLIFSLIFNQVSPVIQKLLETKSDIFTYGGHVGNPPYRSSLVV